MMMDSYRSIARETLELEYSWDSKGVGKMEIFYNMNSVE